MTQNVDVAVVSEQFEECMVGAVPVVENFFHHVFPSIEFEPDRAFVGFGA